MINRKPGLLYGKFFPVAIRTKAFIKPYLESLYGSPVIFNSNNLFGKVISGLLERPHKTFEKKETLEFRVFDKLDSELIIYLPKTWIEEYRHGFAISTEGMCTLTKFFECMFEEDLYKFCDMGRIYKVETKKSIEEFCHRHHINIGEEYDDHITYDCLKKKEQRFRKLQEELKQQSPQKLSLHFYTSKKII